MRASYPLRHRGSALKDTARRRAWLVLLGLIAAGCRQDMHDQPKYIPYRPATFFADQRSERTPLEGTIPRGHLSEDALLETGKTGDSDATMFPFAVDEVVMARGRERFNVYCSPCHGRTGDGNGMIVQRGYRHPPSFHIDRLRQAPPGHIFDVITNGFGAMPDYSVEVRVRDRWAIAAYIRALQLSQHATESDLTAEGRAALARQSTPSGPQGGNR
jgi:mono/diheme cytochrome c family protein